MTEEIRPATTAADASAISFTPNGSIAATDVQAAIVEVRDEASVASGGLPLTGVVNGEPVLLWDENDSLIGAA